MQELEVRKLLAQRQQAILKERIHKRKHQEEKGLDPKRQETEGREQQVIREQLLDLAITSSQTGPEATDVEKRDANIHRQSRREEEHLMEEEFEIPWSLPPRVEVEQEWRFILLGSPQRQEKDKETTKGKDPVVETHVEQQVNPQKELERDIEIIKGKQQFQNAESSQF